MGIFGDLGKTGRQTLGCLQTEQACARLSLPETGTDSPAFAPRRAGTAVFRRKISPKNAAGNSRRHFARGLSSGPESLLKRRAAASSWGGQGRRPRRCAVTSRPGLRRASAPAAGAHHRASAARKARCAPLPFRLPSPDAVRRACGTDTRSAQPPRPARRA